MPFRSLTPSTPTAIMPSLTPHEWRDVQRAVRAVQDSTCPNGEQPGAWRRGLARLSQIMPVLRTRTTRPVAPELEPLRDFLCESARHGPQVDKLAELLERQGYTPAQIAALSFIAG